MEQKPNRKEIKSQDELLETLDMLYQETKETIQSGKQPKWKNLLEIASSDVVIQKAIHDIKGNAGSLTAGVDGKTINNYLQGNATKCITEIKMAFKQYSPQPVRRVEIPKPGKEEKRPLGIPTMLDRIIQMCVKITIEPILEAQFYEHSYGFRPQRDAAMALERVCNIAARTKNNYWVVEGDIKGFFDNVNHCMLSKQLWAMGIRDRRILMIIKQMLKAGIANIKEINDIGTPQGGIISPLLANVYLHKFDKWVDKQWNNKKTKIPYKQKQQKFHALRKSGIKPAYLVRYADDWIIITDTKKSALMWKYRCQKFLQKHLKLELSMDKTKITNIKTKPIVFLGFKMKMVRGKSKDGWITRTYPDQESLNRKLKLIQRDLRNLNKRPIKNKEELICRITLINSKIRGIINYYQCSTWANIYLDKLDHRLKITAYCNLRQFGAKWVRVKQTTNMQHIHQLYNDNTPAVESKKGNNEWYGITLFRFSKWVKTPLKNQEETPYTAKGRALYEKRTKRKNALLIEEHFNTPIERILKVRRKSEMKYNTEYQINRGYAYNRDKGKCRICKKELIPESTHTHHIKVSLPLEKINKLNNLASLHGSCHTLLHSNVSLTDIRSHTVRNNIEKYRKLYTT